MKRRTPWRSGVCAWLLWLLAVGAHAGSYDDYFKAVRDDDADSVRALLQRGFDPNSLNPQGQSGLYLAIRNQSLQVLNVLLSAPRIRFDARNLDDETPLMLAALKGQMDVVRYLVSLGADVNKPGWTPLHYAASGGQLEVMAYLLAQHAYIDAESPNRSTPLMLAARYAGLPAVQLLIEAGADASLTNDQAMRALDFARNPDRPDVLHYLQGLKP